MKGNGNKGKEVDNKKGRNMEYLEKNRGKDEW